MAIRTGLALGTLRTILTVLAIRTGLALGTLGTVCTVCAVLAIRTGLTLRALRAVLTVFAIRTGLTLGTLRAVLAVLAIGTGLTLRSLGTGGTIFTIFTVLASCAGLALGPRFTRRAVADIFGTIDLSRIQRAIRIVIDAIIKLHTSVGTSKRSAILERKLTYHSRGAALGRLRPIIEPRITPREHQRTTYDKTT